MGKALMGSTTADSIRKPSYVTATTAWKGCCSERQTEDISRNFCFREQQGRRQAARIRAAAVTVLQIIPGVLWIRRQAVRLR